jgi:hypothetical protein
MNYFAEGLFSAFVRTADFLKATKGGEFYVGGCSVPADLPEAVMDQAVGLAKSLAE